MGTPFMPFGGLRNEEAARSCGFTNRLQWAGFKKRHGIEREKTRSGSASDALKARETAAEARMETEAEQFHQSVGEGRAA